MRLMIKADSGNRSEFRSDLSQAGPPQIEAQCRTLLDIVQSAIETSTPWAKPSVWSNTDFDDECKAAVKEVRRLRRRHTRTEDPYEKGAI